MEDAVNAVSLRISLLSTVEPVFLGHCMSRPPLYLSLVEKPICLSWSLYGH